LRKKDILAAAAIFNLIVLFTVVLTSIGAIIAPLLVGLLEILAPVLIMACIYIVVIGVSGIEPNTFWHPSSKPKRSKYQPITLKSEFAGQTAVADKARLKAGYQPNDNPNVQIADIGLLVDDGAKLPKLCRSSAVPTDAIQIRPFIILDTPYLASPGIDSIICFNLIDGMGKLCFQSKARYHLKQGQNFIIPKTWMLLGEQLLGDTWSLEVSIGELPPFAIHQFEWLELGGEARAQFDGDGEIDELMEAAINQSAEEPMSIDESLADQGNEELLVMNAKR
jgi:hypothetical protein